MHTLMLLRHAKSDWSIFVSDHKRPLNKRGKKDVPVMAQRLKSRSYKPDRIVSSSALRARSTAEVFSAILECDCIVDDALYEAKKSSIIDIIREMDEEIKDLIFVGHNPTWEMLAEYLTGESITMPTCSMVQISFDCKWKDVSAGNGKITYQDYPKKEHIT